MGLTKSHQLFNVCTGNTAGKCKLFTAAKT